MFVFNTIINMQKENTRETNQLRFIPETSAHGVQLL
jgi:hypothetical protein